MAYVTAAAAVIGTAVSAASAAGAFTPSGGGGSKTPTIPGPDTTQVLKSLIPGEKANASANAGGGISPNFLAGLVGQQAGQPGGGLDVLGDIRSSLNLPQGP